MTGRQHPPALRAELAAVFRCLAGRRAAPPPRRPVEGGVLAELARDGRPQ